MVLAVASTTRPVLNACELKVRTSQGLHSTIPGSPNVCTNEKDGYLNSKPTHVNFEFHFSFTYTVTQSRPQYIDSDYKLGIVSASVQQEVQDKTGM